MLAGALPGTRIDLNVVAPVGGTQKEADSRAPQTHGHRFRREDPDTLGTIDQVS
jgi:hypothetical protein